MSVHKAEVSEFSTDGVLVIGDFTPGDVIPLHLGAQVVILTGMDAQEWL
ncbi:hypothetical protein CCUG60885_04209 [Mycobacteroides salmoniphilum]|uniref:Uncharacterized protein n=1 Tax=Mycobacteroides salmoniphilum TaxID=404941 RepID=A0A4R8SBV8_9MYCO|nr:hypothetical protein CCUG60885_04209 [Mycobacteroides salmoniphilum]TEA07325.1 hypothetical protein CCUG60883_01358 [Mycobacteroides salmoniphilum]